VVTHLLAHRSAARKERDAAIEEFIGQGFDHTLKDEGFLKNLPTAT
jgi:hypothetical protein